MPDTAPPPASLDRRTVLTGAAWAVPAIVFMSSSPAHAAGSNSPYITVSTPNQQIVATGDATVTATVATGPGGAPAAGQPVTFAAPAGATVTPATATTDGNGVATTTVNLSTPWRTPGSTVTVTAISGGQSTSQPLTVLGANALATGIWTGAANRGVSTSRSFEQVDLVFPSPIVQIVSSYCVLLQNGTVWTRSSSNGFGQNGDGTTTGRDTWAVVPNFTGVTQIATANGTSHFALRSDGTVWSWGRNDYGQLGLGDTASRSLPTRITPLSGVTQINARRISAYAVTNGAVWSWGRNDFGI